MILLAEVHWCWTAVHVWHLLRLIKWSRLAGDVDRVALKKEKECKQELSVRMDLREI